ncbi:hypothetical protein Trydic_g6020 [Trypoxylus dichotomus]
MSENVMRSRDQFICLGNIHPTAPLDYGQSGQESHHVRKFVTVKLYLLILRNCFTLYPHTPNKSLPKIIHAFCVPAGDENTNNPNCECVCRQILSSSPLSYSGNSNNPALAVLATTEDELIKIIAKFPDRRTAGDDGIASFLM